MTDVYIPVLSWTADEEAFISHLNLLPLSFITSNTWENIQSTVLFILFFKKVNKYYFHALFFTLDNPKHIHTHSRRIVIQTLPWHSFLTLKEQIGLFVSTCQCPWIRLFCFTSYVTLCNAYCVLHYHIVWVNFCLFCGTERCQRASGTWQWK